MRIVFMGTPDFAVPSFTALAGSSHTLVGVFTQPPRPAGRGHREQKSPIHNLAENLGLPVFTPEKLTGNALTQLAALQPNVICVAAYGLLLPQAVLDIAPCVNVHPSALPRWRGAAPIQHTVLAGDTTTDVCIMAMEAGLDTGPVYLRETFSVGENETAGDLHDRLAAEGARLLLDVINRWPDVTATPQSSDGVTYAHKITPDMRPIDWNKPARDVHNHIRGLSPWPGATTQHDGTTLKLLRTHPVENKSSTPGTILVADASGIVVAAADGALAITNLQRPGKKPMPADEFLRGYPLSKGDKLS